MLKKRAYSLATVVYIQDAPETLTVIVHSVVWSLVEMECWLVDVNKYLLYLKTLFHFKSCQVFLENLYIA
jgi:hypothetical protein